MDDCRALLRHGLATLAYRAAKTLRDAPDEFATFTLPSARSSDVGRTPLQVMAHMGDLIEWSLSAASATDAPVRLPPRPHLSEEIERFFNALERLDAFLASPAEMAASAARLVQGPIADALTHVGQLALLRRECGAPIARESYFDADIVIGRVGFDQAPPRA
jgi:hypothetical protein